MHNTALDTLLQHPRIWRGERGSWTEDDHMASGFSALDRVLPGGGWPQGALTEVLLPHPGIGELQLLLPALRQLNQEQRWIALIAPPYIPYAPAWQAAGLDLSRLLWVRPRTPVDQLWAMEQALHSGTCGAVITWPTTFPKFQQLRRLQLAAEASQAWAVVLEPLSAAAQTSPAALRLQLAPTDEGLAVHLLKRRGAWAGEAVELALA